MPHVVTYFLRGGRGGFFDELTDGFDALDTDFLLAAFFTATFLATVFFADFAFALFGACVSALAATDFAAFDAVLLLRVFDAAFAAFFFVVLLFPV